MATDCRNPADERKEAAAGVRQARAALLAAVNAHDVEAVTGFLHPEFVARNGRGQVVADRRRQLSYAAWLLRRFPDCQEFLAIERVEVDGDIARLTTSRTERFRWLGWLRQEEVRRQVETWMRTPDGWRMVEEQPVSEPTAPAFSEVTPAPPPAGRGDEAAPSEP
jgi:ketosteroid isomerase-like protein